MPAALAERAGAEASAATRVDAADALRADAADATRTEGAEAIRADGADALRADGAEAILASLRPGGAAPGDGMAARDSFADDAPVLGAGAAVEAGAAIGTISAGTKNPVREEAQRAGCHRVYTRTEFLKEIDLILARYAKP